MDLFRLVAIAIAALCAACTAAAAWQLPKAQPTSKAEACAEMGEGYIRVPGSTTCVRLSGMVRVEAAHDGGGTTYDPTNH